MIPEDPSNTSDDMSRDSKGRFLAGNSGNGGRRKGARSKLGEAFLEALATDFAEHGDATIRLARMRDPLGYLKLISAALPREVTLKAFSLNVTAELASKGLAFNEQWLIARQHIGAEPEPFDEEHGLEAETAWRSDE
jgi:hypothetical protein